MRRGGLTTGHLYHALDFPLHVGLCLHGHDAPCTIHPIHGSLERESDQRDSQPGSYADGGTLTCIRCEL